MTTTTYNGAVSLRERELDDAVAHCTRGLGIWDDPFDVLMLNDMDCFHLVIDAIDRVRSLGSRASGLRQQMIDERLRHRAYTREVGDDPPDVRDWTWQVPPRA